MANAHAHIHKHMRAHTLGLGSNNCARPVPATTCTRTTRAQTLQSGGVRTERTPNGTLVNNGTHEVWHRPMRVRVRIDGAWRYIFCDDQGILQVLALDSMHCVIYSICNVWSMCDRVADSRRVRVDILIQYKVPISREKYSEKYSYYNFNSHFYSIWQD